MKKSTLLFTCVSICLFSGCTTILNGTNQNIRVLTPPTTDAQCTLENDKGKWHINKTPGHIVVRRSDKKLLITCEKKAFDKKSVSVKPTLSNLVYGNLLFGGVIGGTIDRQNGSAYDYPSEINVPLNAEK